MRKHYLDNIKWMVQVLVVLFHVFFMYMSDNLNPQAVFGQITDKPFIFGDLFQYIVYPWFMTLLFIAAGMSSKIYLDSHTDKEFIKSRTTRLLVPSTIGILAFGYVQGYLNMALAGALGTTSELPLVVQYLIMCVSGTGVLWFLQVLWVCSVLLVLIRKIEKGRLLKVCSKTGIVVLILMVIPFYGAGLILNPVIASYRFGLYILAFLTGYFIFSHEEVMEKVKKMLPLFAAAGIGSCVLFCVRHFGESYAESPVNRSISYVLCSYFMSVAVLGSAAKYLDFTSPVMTWIYRKSFGIYVFHYIGLSAVAVFVAGKMNLPAAVIYILSAIAAFGGALIVNAIISRIPFLRWAVLGIKKRKVVKDAQG